MNAFLLFLGGGILIASIANAVSTLASSIFIRNVGVNVLNQNATGINYLLELTIENTSETTVRANSFQGGLYFGERLISPLTLQREIQITPGINTINMDGRVNYLNLSTNLVDLISSGDWKQSVSVRGSLQLPGLRIPIDRKLTINDFT